MQVNRLLFPVKFVRLSPVQLVALSSEYAKSSLQCLFPLYFALPVVVILLSYLLLRVICVLSEGRLFVCFIIRTVLIFGFRLGLRMHWDYDLLEGVVLRNLLVTFSQLLKHLLGELVNGLVHLTSVRIRLVFKHVVTVELDTVAKHSNSFFRVKAGVHSSRVLGLLKMRNVCRARSFAEQVVVTVLDLLVLFLLLCFWPLQSAGLT